MRGARGAAFQHAGPQPATPMRRMRWEHTFGGVVIAAAASRMPSPQCEEKV